MKRTRLIVLLGTAALLTVVSIAASATAASAEGAYVWGPQIWRGANCVSVGSWQSCWQARTVTQAIVTPSGNWVFSTHAVNDWTYYQDGVQVGTSHGVSQSTQITSGSDDVVNHQLSLNWVRLGDLQCRAVLNIQIVGGEVRHSVDLDDCA